METPEAQGKQRRPSARALYAWVGMVLLGQAMLVLHLLQHRSITPALWERYSVKFALFLGVVLVMFVGAVLWAAVRWRHLPARMAWIGRLHTRRPGLVAGMLAAGVVLVATALFFSALIALFFPPLPFLASLAVIYAGLAGLIVSTLPRPHAVALGQRLLLILAGVLIGAGLGEVGLRLATRATPYRILPEAMHATFSPAPDVLPGLHGRSTYTTNAVGIRGDPFAPEGRYTILAVGGSTTECAYLDDTEAWPYLLQQTLNRQGAAPPVWVGNVGRSGHGLVEHIHALRYFVPQFRLDAVIVMVGINDMAPALWDLDAYEAWADPDNLAQHLYKSFYSRPLVDAAMARPFPQNTAVWNLVEQSFWNAYHSLDDLKIEDLTGLNYEKRRQRYRQATVVINALPDLTAALDRYERNLLTLIDAARAQGLRLVLTTQPALWSDHLSPEAEKLLWFGMRRAAEGTRYSVSVQQRALGLFNERLLQICHATATECVDLAAAMNGNERYFYDDVHFNEPGARAVATLLAEYLVSGF